MNKRIENILRCYAAGMSIKETATTFHTSRNTVRKYVCSFQAGKASNSFSPSPRSSYMRYRIPSYKTTSRKKIKIWKLNQSPTKHINGPYMLSEFKKMLYFVVI